MEMTHHTKRWNHNLSPSVEKSKEIVVDSRRGPAQLRPLTIDSPAARSQQDIYPFSTKSVKALVWIQGLVSTSSLCSNSSRPGEQVPGQLQDQGPLMLKRFLGGLFLKIICG